MKKILTILLALNLVTLASALVISNSTVSSITPTSAVVFAQVVSTNGTGTNPVLTCYYDITDRGTNYAVCAYTNLYGSAGVGSWSVSNQNLSAATKYYFRWRGVEGTNIALTMPSSNWWTTASLPTAAPPSGAYGNVSAVVTSSVIKWPTNFFTVNSNLIISAIGLSGYLTNETYLGTITGATIAAGSVDAVTVTGPNAAITWNTNAISAGGSGSGFPLTNNANLAGYSMTNGSFVGNGAGLTNLSGTNGFVDASITNGFATTGYVAGAVSGLATGTPLYEYTETDPNWAGVSNDITGKAGNGDTAYGWGNHATNDYATGTPLYVESDPNWGSVSNDITGKAGHGDTAYGWGNWSTNGLATGTPVYVESDPNWAAVSNDITGKAGHGDTAYGWGNHATNDYATGTPLYVESDPNWGTVSNQIQTNLNRIANEYPVLSGSANVTVTPTSTGQVLSVTIGGVEYGTSDSTAYRGDWGAAVSNKAASALQSEVDPNWGAVSNDITGQAGHGDTAYGWGNHATNDYATGTLIYVESDPNWAAVSNTVVYSNTPTYTDAVAKASAALPKSGGTTTGGITNIYGYGMGTNLITMFGGVLNGTNGVYWTIGTNDYWMLFR